MHSVCKNNEVSLWVEYKDDESEDEEESLPTRNLANRLALKGKELRKKWTQFIRNFLLNTVILTFILLHS